MTDWDRTAAHHELFFVHSEDVDSVAKHASQQRPDTPFIVVIMDLSDRTGRALAIKRYGSEAVELFSQQAKSRHKTPIKIADIALEDMDAYASGSPGWDECKADPLPASVVRVAVITEGHFAFFREPLIQED